jgi:UDP-perosamine 4-acetyltransferase
MEIRNDSHFISSLNLTQLVTKRPQLIGVGAGGHARVMIDVHQRRRQFELVGLLEQNPLARGAMVQGVPVIGDDTLLSKLLDNGISNAFIGVGTPRDCTIRERLWNLLQKHRFHIVDTIDPESFLSPLVKHGSGVTVFARATIQAGTRLGLNVLVNTGAIVDHDCSIADHVHIASGAVLAGGVTVESGAMVGAGAVIKPGIRIGAHAVVGAGAVVVHDVNPNSVVVGNPAKILNKEQRSWMISQAS